jgi:diguanylate cyclase (GGDEF)-like protein
MRINVYKQPMSLRVFYFAVIIILTTIAALSLAWEFWLEDLVMPALGFRHEPEGSAERWEFVVTTVVFSAIALIGPAVVGTRFIRHDQALQEEITRLSQEDYLTGLFNRRRITQLLEHEVRRALRYDTTFSVILMDIDHFKWVNDQFGHQAGDAVLKMIADVIKTGVRASDFVGRWGGEEFIILSPQTDIAGAISLAEKMLARLASAEFDKVGRRTASFGVASFNQGDDIEALIGRADAGLYAAKTRGRNRVEVITAHKQAKSETEAHDNSQ